MLYYARSRQRRQGRAGRGGAERCGAVRCPASRADADRAGAGRLPVCRRAIPRWRGRDWGRRQLGRQSGGSHGPRATGGGASFTRIGGPRPSAVPGRRAPHQGCRPSGGHPLHGGGAQRRACRVRAPLSSGATTVWPVSGKGQVPSHDPFARGHSQAGQLPAGEERASGGNWAPRLPASASSSGQRPQRARGAKSYAQIRPGGLRRSGKRPAGIPRPNPTQNPTPLASNKTLNNPRRSGRARTCARIAQQVPPTRHILRLRSTRCAAARR
jgi:hypothetical protein